MVKSVKESPKVGLSKIKSTKHKGFGLLFLSKEISL